MKDDKTIMFVTASLSFSGAGKIVHFIAETLSNHYEKVYAVAINKEEICERQNGVIYLPPLKEHGGGVKGFLKTIVAIRKIVCQYKPNIVVGFCADVAFCTRAATLFLNNTTVVSAERGDPYSFNTKWKILIPWAFRYSDYCFFQLNHAKEFYGHSVDAKSFVIPNPAFFNGQIGQHNKKKNTIVSAGRFVREKGYKYLISAFDLIRQKHPEYELVIYGEGRYLDEYKKQVTELKLNDFVHFPGFVRNVGDTIKEDGIFVLPSIYEGIPNVLIEALLVGIPTVSSNCNPGGPAFLTGSGKRGLLVPVGDVKGIADSVIRLIEDDTLYKKFEKEGPEIQKQLSPDVIAREWINAFSIISEQQ